MTQSFANFKVHFGFDLKGYFNRNENERKEWKEPQVEQKKLLQNWNVSVTYFLDRHGNDSNKYGWKCYYLGDHY